MIPRFWDCDLPDLLKAFRFIPCPHSSCHLINARILHNPRDSLSDLHKRPNSSQVKNNAFSLMLVFRRKSAFKSWLMKIKTTWKSQTSAAQKTSMTISRFNPQPLTRNICSVLTCTSMIQHDQEMPCYQQRMPVVSPFDPGSSYKPRGPVTFEGRTVELRGGTLQGNIFHHISDLLQES